MRFYVFAFGEQWPVDVRTDLAVILEQVPAAAANVARGDPFELEFYEQGIERTITFSPHNEVYVARCDAMTGGTQTLSRGQALEMMVRLRDDFLELVRVSFPRLAEHPWIRSWPANEDSTLRT